MDVAQHIILPRCFTVACGVGRLLVRTPPNGDGSSFLYRVGDWLEGCQSRLARMETAEQEQQQDVIHNKMWAPKRDACSQCRKGVFYSFFSLSLSNSNVTTGNDRKLPLGSSG